MAISDEEKFINRVDRKHNEFKALQTSTIKGKVLKEFQRLMRVERIISDEMCRCITCAKCHHWKKIQGGHFISRKFTAVAFEPDNVWPQCVDCNKYGYGKPLEYRESLIHRIGIERVIRLEELKDMTFEPDQREYAVMFENYRARYNAIMKQM